jgi:hypothetical protein
VDISLHMTEVASLAEEEAAVALKHSVEKQVILMQAEENIKESMKRLTG